MNEIFDRLLIRILLTFFVCLVLFAYKYAHVIFYPTTKKQVVKNFYPAENPADTLHFFSRLSGIAIIFSALGFDEGQGLLPSLFHFVVWGLLISVLYLISLYIMESIVLYNFDYKDEILKRKNMTYALVSFSHALCIAYVSRNIIIQSENSLVILFILWLLAMVVLGFGSKYYSIISKLSFNKLVIQRQPSLAFSYMGFTLGAGFLIGQCFEQDHFDITMYCIQVVLKIMLSLLIYPIFHRGLQMIFKVNSQQINSDSSPVDPDMQGIGYGLYEGLIFLTGAILTSLIVNKIQFGTIYPFF